MPILDRRRRARRFLFAVTLFGGMCAAMSGTLAASSYGLSSAGIALAGRE